VRCFRSTRLNFIVTTLGAWELNHRSIAVVTAGCLFLIHLTLHKRWGVDWHSLVHALVSAIGSIACVYLDLFSSKTLTGTAEPLRMCQCAGPLTSLHKILPVITMGYALMDLLESLSMSIDFIVHGLVTFGMLYFCETGNPHFISQFLLLEGSTP